MTPEEDKRIIEILKTRDALETHVQLKSGKVAKLWNIAWGYDMGDDFAHITTNISPGQPEQDMDFFYTHEIVKINDGESGICISSFDPNHA
nr:putative integron gene cassette protein [uncultured bacterium]